MGLDDLLANFARTLGKMSAEVQLAYREGVSSSQLRLKTDAELLIGIADELGINTKGKTKDQIADEIVKKTR